MAGPGRAARLYRWLHDAVPPWPLVLFGSFGWGLAMTIAALAAIWLHNQLTIPSPLATSLLYFYGGALAFAPSVMMGRLVLPKGLPWIVKLVGASPIVALITHIMTSGIFALQYRVFYSYWHAEVFTVIWFFQLAFTSAGAIYQFTVDSLYFYWPFSLAFFPGFGVWFARGRH